MAVTRPRIDITAGIETAFNSGATGYSGGKEVSANFSQPAWVSTAAATNIIAYLGRMSGTLAAGATVTLDLTAFTSADGNGTINFAKIVAFAIGITSTTAGGKLIIGNGTNPNGLWFGANTQTWQINANGPWLTGGDVVSASGITVDGTHKTVKLNNTSGVSVDYLAFFGGN